MKRTGTVGRYRWQGVSIIMLLMLALVASACGGTASTNTGPTKALKQITLFVGPIPLLDSLWMADQQGYFKQEGLSPVFRSFPSGTTALVTFKSGQGDMVFSGDLPALEYWSNNNHDLRVFADMERDTESLGVIARNNIKSAQDLKGKVIATRVGSTGSFLIDQYLSKNGMRESDVTIKNLDPQVQVTALCNGDISAFFTYAPFTQRASEICGNQVHQITSGKGYAVNFDLAVARPEWLNKNQSTVEAFLRAASKGAAYAKGHLAAVEKYGADKYSLSRKDIDFQEGIQERPITLDAAFYSYFTSEAKWAHDTSNMKDALSWSTFADVRALKAVGYKSTPPTN